MTKCSSGRSVTGLDRGIADQDEHDIHLGRPRGQAGFDEPASAALRLVAAAAAKIADGSTAKLIRQPPLRGDVRGLRELKLAWMLQRARAGAARVSEASWLSARYERPAEETTERRPNLGRTIFLAVLPICFPIAILGSKPSYHPALTS